MACASLGREPSFCVVNSLKTMTSDIDHKLWNACGLTEVEQLRAGRRQSCELPKSEQLDRAQQIKSLIERGARVDAKNGKDYRRSATYYAAVTGNIPAVDVLLEAGAKVDAKDTHPLGGTALGKTLELRDYGMAIHLVRAGAQLEHTSIRHATPELLDALVAAGARLIPSVVRDLVHGALMSDTGTLPVLQWLVDHGFNLLERDRRGLDILEGQRHGRQHPDAVAFLNATRPLAPRPKGAKPDNASTGILTALGRKLGLAARQSAESSGDYEHYEQTGLDPDDLRLQAWDSRDAKSALSVLRKTAAFANLDHAAALEVVQKAYDGAWDTKVKRRAKGKAKTASNKKPALPKKQAARKARAIGTSGRPAKKRARQKKQ